MAIKGARLYCSLSLAPKQVVLWFLLLMKKVLSSSKTETSSDHQIIQVMFFPGHLGQTHFKNYPELIHVLRKITCKQQSAIMISEYGSQRK